ncbi:MAG: ankyrin repeat domain-containing protein [Maribacter sp.]
MFWNKKPKLPITPEDQIWVEESLTFLKESLREEKLLVVKTVEPSKAFFERNFDGSEMDAEFILDRCQELMDIPTAKVELEFYSEEAHYLDDGTLLSSSADIFGKSSGAAGTYQKKGGKSIIRIEHGQLKDTEGLIATICHELSHEKLLGENRIIENDEYLTDLTAIVFGFGIFIGNAKFQFEAGKGNGFGWQMKSQGYLPEPIIAYTMASLALKRKESNFNYSAYLNETLKNYFDKSLAYLINEEQNDTSKFWLISKKEETKSDFNASMVEFEDPLYGPEKRKELQTEMRDACYGGDVVMVESLLQKRLSPNFNTIGGSPLTIAVKQENKELIDCLLHYGADINFSESENMMDTLPLMAACENESIAMIKYLIDLGAEIDRVAGNGKSILSVAVETSNQEVVNFLLKAGAHPEIKSGYYMNFNTTPITAAVMNNDTEMVSFLVENGAKTKPIRKMTRHEMHPKMVKFLKARKYL